ncbi:diacylglycerol O-acyltransferase [Marinobacterium nitratireducens]|uniref:diacylglycerol O-acyltransferase n=1 Tax=Marinobacterium nitratireducens TaxID=518897 RepID=A0A917ZBQ0_9GAMM|nr:wax ester/triacylglycerol synthase family O-acyltransferase [Marinobacterium nitratireducens]GGO80185.1 diacylglycerol O-acyltransferase [Marinobacterium nitratireducens]
MKRQLHSMDSLYLYLDAENAQICITPVFFYDPSTAKGGELTHAQLLDQLRRSIKVLPVMRSRLERLPLDVDNPYLAEDPNFRLENHVREVTLPAPGNWQALRQALGDFQASKLDTSVPLWEMVVFRGLSGIDWLPKGAFAIAMKFHHVVVDGHSLIEIVGHMHDEGQTIAAKNPELAQRRYEAPPLLDRMTQAVSNNLLGAINMVSPLLSAAPGITKTLVGEISRNATSMPQLPVKTRFNAPVSAKRVWDLASFDLPTIKQIAKQQPGATINDVVLTIVGGGLRTYLQSKGDSVNQVLRAVAPMNVRHESEYNQGGTEISYFFPDLPVHLEDPRAQLQHAATSARKAKEVANGLGGRQMNDFSKNIPAAYFSSLNLTGMLGKAASTLLNMNGNTVVTNVPGPATQLHLGGATLVNLSGIMLIGDGMGMNHCVNSYDGKLNISVVSCPELMPDPEFYVECLLGTYEALKQAFGIETPNPDAGSKQTTAKAATAQPEAAETAAKAAKPATRTRKASSARKPSTRSKTGTAKAPAAASGKSAD